MPDSLTREILSQTILQFQQAIAHLETPSEACVPPPVVTAATQLVEIVDRVRSPLGGWPSDREPSPENLAPYVVDETQDLLEALQQQPRTTVPNHPLTSLQALLHHPVLLSDLVPHILWAIARSSPQTMQLLGGLPGEIFEPGHHWVQGTLRLVTILEIRTLDLQGSIDLATLSPPPAPLNFDTLIRWGDRSVHWLENWLQTLQSRIEATSILLQTMLTKPLWGKILAPTQTWNLGSLQLSLQLTFQPEGTTPEPTESSQLLLLIQSSKTPRQWRDISSKTTLKKRTVFDQPVKKNTVQGQLLPKQSLPEQSLPEQSFPGQSPQEQLSGEQFSQEQYPQRQPSKNRSLKEQFPQEQAQQNQLQSPSQSQFQRQFQGKPEQQLEEKSPPTQSLQEQSSQPDAIELPEEEDLFGNWPFTPDQPSFLPEQPQLSPALAQPSEDLFGDWFRDISSIDTPSISLETDLLDLVQLDLKPEKTEAAETVKPLEKGEELFANFDTGELTEEELFANFDTGELPKKSAKSLENVPENVLENILENILDNVKERVGNPKTSEAQDIVEEEFSEIFVEELAEESVEEAEESVEEKEFAEELAEEFVEEFVEEKEFAEELAEEFIEELAEENIDLAIDLAPVDAIPVMTDWSSFVVPVALRSLPQWQICWPQPEALKLPRAYWIQQGLRRLQFTSILEAVESNQGDSGSGTLATRFSGLFNFSASPVSFVQLACEVLRAEAQQKTLLDIQFLPSEGTLADLFCHLCWQLIYPSYPLTRLLSGIPAQILQPGWGWDQGTLRLLAIVSLKGADLDLQVDLNNGAIANPNTWLISPDILLQANTPEWPNLQETLYQFKARILEQIQQFMPEISLLFPGIPLSLRHPIQDWQSVTLQLSFELDFQ